MGKSKNDITTLEKNEMKAAESKHDPDANKYIGMLAFGDPYTEDQVSSIEELLSGTKDDSSLYGDLSLALHPSRAGIIVVGELELLEVLDHLRWLENRLEIWYDGFSFNGIICPRDFNSETIGIYADDWGIQRIKLSTFSELAACPHCETIFSDEDCVYDMSEATSK